MARALWTAHIEGGPKRVNHAAVTIRDFIFSFGGYCTGDDYDTERPIDVHRFYTVTLHWCLLPLPTTKEEVASAPYQRYGHTVVEYKGDAYLWGGRNDRSGACDILYRFDGTTYVWDMPKVSGSVPLARDGHAASVIGHRMYIFAGYEEGSDRFSNNLDYLDLMTFMWISVDCNNRPARWRDFHTMTAVGEKLYVFGGRCDEGGDVFTNREIYCNKVMVFNTSTNSWSQQAQTSRLVPVGRRSHSAFALNGSLYVFGGYNGIRHKHFNDLHRLDLSTMEWTEEKYPGVCPSPRRRQCCCVVQAKVYFFGGTSPKNPKTISPDLEDIDLVDRSDLFVLDFRPSLKTLSSVAIIKNKLDISDLPQSLKRELSQLYSENTRLNTTNG